jgi:hypothetical protein
MESWELGKLLKEEGVRLVLSQKDLGLVIRPE